MLFILDTNVISELMKPDASTHVMSWFLKHTRDQFATTAINQAEILGGLALLPEGKRKREMLATAQSIWDVELKNEVYAFDTNCAQAFAAILRRRTRAGQPIQFADAAISAICSAHKATIVTRDISDFEGCGIQITNPWIE
jgi:toxin FitB